MHDSTHLWDNLSELGSLTIHVPSNGSFYKTGALEIQVSMHLELENFKEWQLASKIVVTFLAPLGFSKN